MAAFGWAVVGALELGVLAYEAGSLLVLSDVSVRATRPTASGLVGIGAGSYLSGSVVADRFLLIGSALAGVQLARGGTVDLHGGEVSGNPIGANVQTEGFDLARLQDRVVYRDNIRGLAADELPVPDPALPAEER